jgi:hypothetical protein
MLFPILKLHDIGSNFSTFETTTIIHPYPSYIVLTMFQPWLESPKVGGKSPQLKFFSMVFITFKSPSLVLKSLQRGAPSEMFFGLSSRINM